MRRKIELFIDGTLADLSDQGLILFNYSLTDLQKPTAVKNSFSKQITLPGTPANDAIFEHAYRPDRVASNFNQLERTPFEIYNELGEVLQSGYLKLDKVNRAGSTHTYSVTLYGGLGGFFYGLMFNADGSKRSLADIEYYHDVWSSGTNQGKHEVSLTRVLNAAMINTSWLRLDDYEPTSTPRASYRVLNWAPCYNGFPEEFDADKVVVYPSYVGGGIPDTLTDDDGNIISPYNGAGIAKLAKKYDEWAIRDLRSYLQRPILNVQAFLDSLSMPVNNGGYTIDWKTRPPKEEDLWLTLKTLSEVEYGSETQTQEYDEEHSSLVSFPTNYLTWFNVAINARGETTLTLTLKPSLRAPSVPSGSNVLYEAWDRTKGSPGTQETAAGATIMQVVGYDQQGNVKAASALYVFTNPTSRKTLTEVAEDVLEIMPDYFEPTKYPEVGYAPVNGHYERVAATSHFTWNTPATVTLTGQRLASFSILVARLSDEHQRTGSYAAQMAGWNTVSGFASVETGYNGVFSGMVSGTAETVVSALRSGATVEKEDLLQSNRSVGEYLLSLGKLFGWLFTCDEKSKTVTVWDRNSFYTTGEDTIDLSRRIDRAKDINITPVYAASRIYNFAPEAIGGKAEEYEDRYGRVYGSYRVDTGYEFNSEAVEMVEGIAFSTAVWWLARGKDYSWPYVGSDWHFSWEQDGYELTYGGVGTGAYTAKMPAIFATSWESYGSIPFADLIDKPMFQDADGGQVAGEDCLLYMVARSEWFPRSDMYQLTDDNDMMYFLNGDKPCWLCGWNTAVDGVYAILNANQVPQFLPYSRLSGQEYDAPWLTFGIPQELYDPNIPSWSEDATLYARFWRSYLRDLLDKDTKVMKCRVNLEGLQVGPQLLRRFFWYENSLWVLNKITNYSLTTYDPAECEFVQVRNIENYTNGQIWTW